MRAVDNAVLALLRDTGVNVWDGYMEVAHKDAEGRSIVTYALPYVVYTAAVGDDDNRRLSGREQRRSVPFYLTYVGSDRNQTKWLGEKLRAAVKRTRPVVPGFRAWPIELEESQRIWRDDEAATPDGSPIYYGVDGYAVSITPTGGNPL